MIRECCLGIVVTNCPGVLVRISLVFSRRGYNINSLVVSPFLGGDFSHMTITTSGDSDSFDQIIKQLKKLPSVLSAKEYGHEKSIQKELCLIKIQLENENRCEILQLIDSFEGRNLHLSKNQCIVMFTGNSSKLNNIEQVFKVYHIIEMVRTGKVMMSLES